MVVNGRRGSGEGEREGEAMKERERKVKGGRQREGQEGGGDK